MNKYILYIYYKDRFIEYPLPSADNRMVTIDLSIIDSGCNMYFEVFDGNWTVISTPNTIVRRNNGIVNRCNIHNEEVYNVEFRNANIYVNIMILELSKDLVDFKKYDISNVNTITIGKDSCCDIVISNKFISSTHAVFERKGNDLFVTDKSKNGLFINGERIQHQTLLKKFDVIYSVGFKIVLIDNVLAINGASYSTINSNKIKKFNGSIINNSISNYNDTFFRTPRVIQPLYNEKITIEGPPSVQPIDDRPLLFMMGPSLTMPLPILASTMLNSAIRDTSPIMYIGTMVSVLMSAGVGLCWSLANKNYTKKQQLLKETNQTNAYKNYIRKKDEFIEQKYTLNKNILCSQYLSASELVQCSLHNRSLIWNRNKNHDDFLQVRLGLGSTKFQSEIKVPEEKFTTENNLLSEGTTKILQKYEYIDDVPILLNLKENKIVGVIGDTKSMFKIAKSLIVQISALHTYTDVKLALFFKENELSKYSWVKWIPHFFSEDKKTRMIASDKQSTQNVLFSLVSLLRSRSELISDSNSEDGSTKSTKDIDFSPHYVVICTSNDIFENESIEKYIRSNDNLGITFILLYGTMDRLYNECIRVIQCDEEYKGMYLLNGIRDKTNSISFDDVSKEDAETFARTISKFYIKEFTNAEIPTAINYFDILGISRMEQWDLLKHYKENRSYEHIKSLIGVSSNHKLMYLDIHEKAHGPHGLIAGTTGSGKSETIQTFIISLALNYSPNEVSFILIDYKGGGMAKAFEGMPHLVGMITNLSDSEGSSDDSSGSLDENQTRRALISIRSEIKRRQSLFNIFKVNHIDNYTRLYRNGISTEPIPHLIIISDEFAELKKEQPDFIKELISIARVGRSLGIHLILATQKPSGVVDDEINANARFKLCLKVQDKQDSMDMIGRPDASHITITGRGYLQVGNDEIFEMFQTGYSGADYVPKNSFEVSYDKDLEMIELDGSKANVNASKKDYKKQSNIKLPSQLKTCVDYITKVSIEHSIPFAKPIWLPTLSKRISLEYIESKYKVKRENGLVAMYGLIDDPEKQSQYPATIDFYTVSNLQIVGMSEYGKTTLLETILFSLCMNYTSLDFNFYVMDFSSGTLNKFKRYPQCGGVVLSNEVELISRLLTLLQEEISIRKKLFYNKNVGNYFDYLKIKKIPLILLAIDNYSVFKEEFNEHEDRLSVIMREGIRYGIKTIIIDSLSSNITSKVRKNISESIALRLPEKSQYLDVLKSSPKFLPSNCKGRGLVNVKNRILEVQTTVLFEDVNSKNLKKEYDATHISQLNSDIENVGNSVNRTKKVQELQERYNEDFQKYVESKRYNMISSKMEKYSKYILKKNGKLKYAKPIPFIPKDEPYYIFFSKFYNSENSLLLPIGYDCENIDCYYIDLHKVYTYTFSDMSIEGIKLMIDNLITMGKETSAEVYAINLDKNIIINSDRIKSRISNANELFNFMATLGKIFGSRKDKYRQYVAKNPNSDNYSCVEYMDKQFPKVFVIIDNFATFCSCIYDIKNYDPSKSTTSMSSFFEQVLIEGRNRGIYFFAGINSMDFSTAQSFTNVWKTFTKDKYGLNTGGYLDKQKIVNVQNMRILEQGKPREYNTAHTYDNKKLIELYIPKSE